MDLVIDRIYEIQNIGKGEIINILPENLLELYNVDNNTLWERGSGYGSLIPKGSNNTATQNNSIAIGAGTEATGNDSFAGGFLSIATNNNAFAFGYQTLADQVNAFAIGSATTASGTNSFAGNESTLASGYASFAVGRGTIASGMVGSAFGNGTTAANYSTTAFGNFTNANGDTSFAAGYLSDANGDYSFVLGAGSIVNGNYSIVLGQNITGNQNDTTYVDNLNIKTLGVGAPVTSLAIDSNGYVVPAQAQNLQKTITGSTTLTTADNNYTILINNGANPITITVPAGLLSAISIGFIQQGTGDVTFIASGTTIRTPLVGAFKIKGQNYNAYLEQVGNTDVYHLLGNLKV